MKKKNNSDKIDIDTIKKLSKTAIVTSMPLYHGELKTPNNNSKKRRKKR